MGSTPAPAPVEKPGVSGALASSMIPVLVMVTIMWAQEIVDTVVSGRLDRFGIEPRQLDGLPGILFAPFLHVGFGHLIGNTIPFVVLGGIISLGSRERFVQVTGIVAVIGGFGTWLTGAPGSVHIGASGLVFGYLLYLLSRGWFERKIGYILGGVVVFMFYGGVLWGLLPSPGVSWQGHVFGALGGVAAASLMHGQGNDGRARETGDGDIAIRAGR